MLYTSITLDSVYCLKCISCTQILEISCCYTDGIFTDAYCFILNGSGWH
jgi:hypothetical protein